MTDRLQQIREAVARDVSNGEAAYADRAWLLREHERVVTYAELLERAARAMVHWYDYIVDGAAPGSENAESVVALARAALAKNQCGGSGSLSETPRPSTAHPLPAGLKPDKQLDGGPSASGPATQPEPRTICHETNQKSPFDNPCPDCGREMIRLGRDRSGEDFVCALCSIESYRGSRHQSGKNMTETVTVDQDARWAEIQALSRKIAYGYDAPNATESALCGAVVRAQELQQRLSKALGLLKTVQSEWAEVEGENSGLLWQIRHCLGMNPDHVTGECVHQVNRDPLAVLDEWSRKNKAPGDHPEFWRGYHYAREVLYGDSQSVACTKQEER